MLLPDCLWSFYFWGEGGRHRLHRWPELACLIHVCISLELFQFLATSTSFLVQKQSGSSWKDGSQAFVVYFTLMSVPYALVLVWTLIPGIFWMWVLIPGMIVCLSISPYLLRLDFMFVLKSWRWKLPAFNIYIWGILFALNLSLATWSSVGFSWFFHKISEHGCYPLCRQPAMEQFYDSEEVKASTWPIWWWSPEHGRFRLD